MPQHQRRRKGFRLRSRGHNVPVNRSAVFEVVFAQRLARERFNRLFSGEPPIDTERRMSTESNCGKEPETQTPPTGEAGCEPEISRNVLGTVASTGFAEMRFRAHAIRSSALLWRARSRHADDIQSQEAWSDVFEAAKRLCMMLDNRADAKDASSAGETISTS